MIASFGLRQKQNKWDNRLPLDCPLYVSAYYFCWSKVLHRIQMWCIRRMPEHKGSFMPEWGAIKLLILMIYWNSMGSCYSDFSGYWSHRVQRVLFTYCNPAEMQDPSQLGQLLALELQLIQKYFLRNFISERLKTYQWINTTGLLI